MFYKFQIIISIKIAANSRATLLQTIHFRCHTPQQLLEIIVKSLRFNTFWFILIRCFLVRRYNLCNIRSDIFIVLLFNYITKITYHKSLYPFGLLQQADYPKTYYSTEEGLQYYFQDFIAIQDETKPI